MIEHLHQTHGYPVALLCEVVGLPRSTYYHRPTPPDDMALAEAILEILGTFPTYGTRRVTAQLRRAPYRMQVSRKRVQRVIRQKGWLQKRSSSAKCAPRKANTGTGVTPTW